MVHPIDERGDGESTAASRAGGRRGKDERLAIVPTTGRLDTVTLPTGVVDIDYDAQGRASTVRAPGGVVHGFGYDGTLVTSLSIAGPVPGSISFVYDNDFAVVGQSVNGEPAVAFAYDLDGLLVESGDLSLVRDVENGFLTTTALGQVADERVYTSFGELDVYTATVGGSSVLGYDLDRDAAGRIVRKTETVQGVSAIWEYAYDPDRGWLTEVKKDGAVVETYAYDGNGNRTSWSDFWGAGSATYDDQDRMLTRGSAAYAYTANGELTTRTDGPETTRYLYDVRGALLSVTLPTGVSIDYVVDASGRRIGKKVNGALVRGWIYAGGLAPLAETDGSGTVTSRFIYGTRVNVPESMAKGGSTYRLLTDHLGSVRLVVDSTTGSVAQRIDYDAFGRITYDSNPGFQPFGFAGGLYDEQTGLVRFGARDYDPEAGRWTAKDPIGFAGGSAGLFEHCGNNAVGCVDRSGLLNEDPDYEVQGPPLPKVDYLELVRAAGEVATEIVRALGDLAAFLTDPTRVQAGTVECYQFGSTLSCGEMKVGVMPLAPRGFVPRAATGLTDDILRLSERNLTHSGDTVLGSFPGYINKASARGASYFDIGDTWESLSLAQRRAANFHFLDIITARRDRVLLSIPRSQIQTGTALSDEIAYLTGKRGYRWLNQWSLGPGG